MTSIGESLRQAREEKGLDLDRVSDETRIAKRFIAALETEDFSVFPGDPYAIGFLKNYAEYLGLDSAELAASFNMLRIQEQPAPIQELLPAKKAPPVAFVAIGLVLVVVIVALIFLIGRGHKTTGDNSLSAPRNPTEYRLASTVLDRRFWIGDSVVFSLGQDSWKIKISSLSDGVSLDTPFGQRRLGLGEESVMDFNGDGQPDLRILLSDLDKRDASKGADIRFTPMGPGSTLAPPSSGDASPLPQAADATQAPDANAPSLSAVPQKTDTATTTKEGTIFEGQKSSYPFVVSVTFRGSCMFRYEVDRKDREEHYYQKGDTITINANNAVKLWASNAQSAAVIVQASGGKSASIDLGGAGEIAVKRIAWVQNDNGSYTLSLFEVD
ncbi:MAG TPA: helix-turn-helix domain-containing protein [Rectinemataceae bacterium]|nr:helix-turn-helix domain-containing protein [Rectinemataceae bacterium]